MQKAFVNTHEAAEYLGLAEITLQIWRQNGNGPPYVKIGRAVRYSLQDLDEWVNARKVSSTTEWKVHGSRTRRSP